MTAPSNTQMKLNSMKSSQQEGAKTVKNPANLRFLTSNNNSIRVLKKTLTIFRRCLHFIFGITRKLERIKIFFGKDSEQDLLYRHTNNLVKTTK